MTYTLDESQLRNLEVSTRKEWLLTNGIGGYALGSASGINTRRYSGHLVAAVKPPAERQVMLASIDAFVQTEGNAVGISANQYPGAIYPEGFHYLRSFAVDVSARWTYKVVNAEIEKELYLHPGVNACTIAYRNTGRSPLLLILRPLVSHKPHHENFAERPDYPSELAFPRHSTVVTFDGLPLHLSHPGAQRLPVQGWYYRFEHARELERGLNPRDDLFCPCELRYELMPGEQALLVASLEAGIAPSLPDAYPEQRFTNVGEMLRSAASKYFVKTDARTSIIAGFPWFTDWGRDTMISIPGLCLCTGRVPEARQILRDYAAQRANGLIPNRFVEAGETPDYNTVDATLWFANAVYKSLEAEWDESFAEEMHAVLEDVLEHHVRGTLFGIGVDPEDGLLRQGEPGVQLTWMDAKIGDWVVTPRHGKPVEINGLWVNALRVMEWLCAKLNRDSEMYTHLAAKAEQSFDDKFWHPIRGYYLDTADPSDASLRPNQVIAMALPFGPAKGERARLALACVTQELFTPVGLRTLAPDSNGYRGQFKGPLPELDSAYHQGTVWPWLLGPYITALVKLNGDRAGAKRILKNAKDMLCEAGLEGVSEVYDGDEPRSPGGCPWQAWSVAELLRAWVEDVES